MVNDLNGNCLSIFIAAHSYFVIILPPPFLPLSVFSNLSISNMHRQTDTKPPMPERFLTHFASKTRIVLVKFNENLILVLKLFNRQFYNEKHHKKIKLW